MPCEVMFQFAVFQSLGRSDDIVAVLEQVCDVLECPSQKCSQAVPMLGHGMCLVAKRALNGPHHYLIAVQKASLGPLC